MSASRTVRGTRDLLPEDSLRLRFVEERAWTAARSYGYGEIATPIFEFTDVFARTLGDASDVVTKEMYTFEDRGGDSLTLRPENTAGIVRAFISNGLAAQLPVRAFYRGPMFRYERPQKGRLRQFHQVGIELLGIGDPLGDVEVIALAHDFLASLDLADKVVLEINTLGDAPSRAAYRDKLVAYLDAHRDRLSPDSLARLDRNPLRVLDSKDAGDREVVAGAPSLADALNETSRAFFASVLDGLDRIGIAYQRNPRLVRGLDYYSHSTFEFVTSALGAQGTVLAGGRYDGLVEQMGGPSTPGTGWAAGVERLMMLLGEDAAQTRPIAVVALGETQFGPAFAIARRLRAAGHIVKFGFGASLGKQMKWANKINARLAVIVGSDEVARAVAAVRDMDAGAQEEVSLTRLEERLACPV
ncbi:MAG: histidine--tRNA ligase [Rhodospirillales bacterium]|nr:histidine--tRNA ligase [Rhodospirillales bacterium]